MSTVPALVEEGGVVDAFASLSSATSAQPVSFMSIKKSESLSMPSVHCVGICCALTGVIYGLAPPHRSTTRVAIADSFFFIIYIRKPLSKLLKIVLATLIHSDYHARAAK